LIKKFTYKDDRISSITFSPNGQSMAVGYIQHIRIWDTRTWKQRQVQGLLFTEELSYSPDGKLLAIVADDITYIWNVRD
jgi:WD40 repeat protein